MIVCVTVYYSQNISYHKFRMVRAIFPRIFFVVSFISEGKMTHMTSRRQKDNKLMKNQSYFSITTS